MRIAITGATGLIGSAVAESLEEDGHSVRRLTRTPRRVGDYQFDPARDMLDPEALRGADAVVHLAGEVIGQRWTESVRHRIRESRVRGTRLVARAIASQDEKPRVLVSSSAIGYYGDRGDELLTEEEGPGSDFLARVCVEWEAAADAAREAGVRVVHPRTGVVITRHGGALQRMLLPFRLGVGGRIGSGEQFLSWISLADAVGGIRHMIGDDAIAGGVNLVSPQPITNAQFTAALGQALHRPTILPVPTFVLRAMYSEMADATLLVSQRAIPEVLVRRGFTFHHPGIGTALADAISSGSEP